MGVLLRRDIFGTNLQCQFLIVIFDNIFYVSHVVNLD